MTISRHMSIDLRGALHNWKDRLWRNCVTDPEGRTMSPRQVKDWLLDELAKGRKVVPFDPACDNFDYQKGCGGHPVEDAQGL